MAQAQETAGRPGTVIYGWLLTDDDPDGDPVAVAEPLSVQVVGDFGGGDVEILGSNEPAGEEFWTLHDSVGRPLVFASPDGHAISDSPNIVSPSLSGGADAEVWVYLLARKEM